ncbi:hypothetical protein EYF80_042489 [Liparis tanakae]|uniref:Uncharacterized protein n=1 Tax=Liparis tanakae TaxID=230148 RepID=A0A4Z2G1C1_9TELE|nr:hypothetical protein EYF80_042489 [Liparis tanakae]
MADSLLGQFHPDMRADFLQCTKEVFISFQTSSVGSRVASSKEVFISFFCKVDCPPEFIGTLMLPAAMCERHRVQPQVEPHPTASSPLKTRDEDETKTRRSP